MAVVGDILVKLEANAAEFTQGLDEANKKLDEFGEHAAKTNQQLNSMAATLTAALVGAGIGLAVNEIKKISDAADKAALEVANLASKFKLSTDQVQALQFMSQRSGVSVEELAKQLKGNTTEVDSMAEALRAAGLIMDKEFIANAKRAADQAEDTTKRINALWAAIAGPAERAGQSALASMLASIGQSLTVIKAQGTDALSVIRSLLNLLSLGIAGAVAGPGSQIEDLDRRIRDLGDTWSATDQKIREIEAKPSPIPSGEQSFLEGLRKRRDELRQQIYDLSKTAADLRKGPPTLPTVTVTATAPGGGGGGAKAEDPVETAIERYGALAKAAQKTAQVIKDSAGVEIEAMQRNVEVQQKIDEVLSRRGVHATDEQRKRLEEVVRASQEAIGLQKQLLEANTRAADIEEKLGDGTKAREHAMRDLNRAMATGRLSQDAYNRSLKQSDEAFTQAALAARRYDDDLGSLAAGFEHAANANARANDLFSVGERAFTGLTNAMGEGLDVLLGKSNKTFGEIAADFASMLAKMALEAAASQVFKMIFGSIAGPTVTAVPWTPVASFPGTFGAPPGLQHGGPVVAGRPYLVGEAGPELFVPQAAGNIVPNSSRAGDTITVNVAMGQTQGAADPSAALAFGRKIKAAIADTIANEKRPGGSLYQRMS
jgi:hypothetical protein